MVPGREPGRISMAKYLARTCPQCRNYLGVVIPEPREDSKEVPINAYCSGCRFKLLITKIIFGKRPMLARLGLLFLFLIPASPGYPHSGGLDAYGCHRDRKRGGYHCHRGQFAGRSFSSKEEMLQIRGLANKDQGSSPKPVPKGKRAE